ncbi:MAG: alkaline phytoceramidase [Thioalkalivibrio sp.]|nr:MAG: alkaline phytoceramidase [Thioalkalivibrio sp.]
MRGIWRAAVLSAAIGAIVAIAWWLPPLPQPEAYHDFAETRRLLGIPHFMDVVSNLAFLVVGVLGLAWLLLNRHRLDECFVHRVESLPYAVLFVAVIGIAIGSAWYHWDPGHLRLYWDRLPMTVAFMSVLAAIITERIDRRIGVVALPVLILLGIGAATHWVVSELQGAGDMRLYLLTQVVPLVIGTLLVLLYSSPYTRGADLPIAAGWYLLALVAQNLDHEIHGFTGGWVSGHTLKHLLAALAIYWILRMLRLRQMRTRPRDGSGAARPP